MKYADLREFLSQLEARGELKRIAAPVSPRLEMTEISDRVLRAGGPALLFEKPAVAGSKSGHDMPVLANLFGTVGRVAAAMGLESEKGLREIGKLLGLPASIVPVAAIAIGRPGEQPEPRTRFNSDYVHLEKW